MRKIKLGLTLFLAVAAIMMMVVPAGAVINRTINGVGDALIFPFFDADKINYVTITNESNSWIQAHVRLRTAAHSVEGRDFPLIMSPGDMVIFEVSRIGYDDKAWRINYSMDMHNFQYVRINSSPTKSLADLSDIRNEFMRLKPEPLVDAAGRQIYAGWTETEIEHNNRYGYIEVIGEAVFGWTDINGEHFDDKALNKSALLDPSYQGYVGPTNTVQYITKGGNTYYEPPITNPVRGYNVLGDVPNVLTGRMYIMEGRYGTGMAYNAVALTDFRTNTPPSAGVYHRVDNYYNVVRGAIDYGVIVTTENGALNDYPGNSASIIGTTAADRNYTYVWSDYSNVNVYKQYEAMISANNTWGPTLADGDSYLVDGNLPGQDDYDFRGNIVTSIREVEAALNQISVRGHYFNISDEAGVPTFQTKLILTLPTKHHVALDLTQIGNALGQYKRWVSWFNMMETTLAPSFHNELWDTDETFVTVETPFDISPRPEITLPPNVIPYELTILTPNYPYPAGRFVLKAFEDMGNDLRLTKRGLMPVIGVSFIDMNGQLGYMTECQY
jgi:hypothetical protein